MNTSRLTVASVVVLAVTTGWAAKYDGADWAPENIQAKDLSKLAKVERGTGGAVVIVDKDDCARMTIVRDNSRESHWAAKQLQETIQEMTGVKLAIVVEQSAARPVPNAPALYVGAVSAAEKAGLKAPTDHAEAYGVFTRDGSVYFLGRSDYAVTDWCERELGVRYYWPKRPCDTYGGKGTNFVYGKCVQQVKGLVAGAWNWEDRPVFAYRENWPYGGAEWNRWSKGGNSHRGGVNVHAPAGWWKEPDAKDHVEIFALSQDGKRPTSPLLCYGNPKTLEYYKMRIRKAIAEKTADPKARDSSGGIVNFDKKVITVSQWDCGVYCACEHCKKLFDEKLGGLGSGSPVIWGYFTKELAKWVKREYPDWMISILPYCNTCLVTPGVDFTAEGNVEAELCTMPGVAMMKNKRCKQYEEDMIRAWEKCTGRKVLNWHYSCWPAEYTSAPFVYGETIKGHYRDMRNDLVGTFINGGYDITRFSLSVYVWMRCLWSPDIDVQAVYDEFARRMFGKAAAPMRQIVRMQEEGWSRQWGSNMCSVKNIFEISYPRKEVLKMAELFAEAEKLAAGDEKALARIAWYKSGFENFFIESEQNANGTAFAPLHMKKVTVAPKVDGRLDDACWQTAEPLPFVDAQINWSGRAIDDKGKDPKKTPKYPTEMRAVWVPSQGVTFGFRFTEPSTEAMVEGVKGDVWDQDMIELFIDVSGTGDGNYCHLLSDAFARTRFDGSGAFKGEQVEVKTAKFAGYWTMEAYVPFSALKCFPGVQIPTTSANGICWNGNCARLRCGDMKKPEAERKQGSVSEISRLNTRFNKWHKDQSAFSTWQFVE